MCQGTPNDYTGNSLKTIPFSYISYLLVDIFVDTNIFLYLR